MYFQSPLSSMSCCHPKILEDNMETKWLTCTVRRVITARKVAEAVRNYLNPFRQMGFKSRYIIFE